MGRRGGMGTSGVNGESDSESSDGDSLCSSVGSVEGTAVQDLEAAFSPMSLASISPPGNANPPSPVLGDGSHALTLVASHPLSAGAGDTTLSVVPRVILKQSASHQDSISLLQSELLMNCWIAEQKPS